MEGGAAAAVAHVPSGVAVSSVGLEEARWRSIQQAFVVGSVSRYTALYFDEEIAEDDGEAKPQPRSRDGDAGEGAEEPPVEPVVSEEQLADSAELRAELEKVVQDARWVVGRQRVEDQVSRAKRRLRSRGAGAGGRCIGRFVALALKTATSRYLYPRYLLCMHPPLPSPAVFFVEEGG